MSKYKIKIGGRVFEAEETSNGDLKLGEGPGCSMLFYKKELEFLGATITEIKEPMRVEYTFVLKENGCSNIRQMTPTFDITFLSKWIGKTVKVTLSEVTEIIPDQCEHEYKTVSHSEIDWLHRYDCKKCGKTFDPRVKP